MTSPYEGSSYVYIRSEPGLYTVGFYKPDGKWEPESDHDTEAKAAGRVAWLNGGQEKQYEVIRIASDLYRALSSIDRMSRGIDFIDEEARATRWVVARNALKAAQQSGFVPEAA